jgi:hypothetical protein
MALASTDFMAAPGAYGTTLAAKLDKIDCSQVLAAVLKADRALLGHIKMGAVAKNVEFHWIEDELNQVIFEGATSLSGSVEISGFTGSQSLLNMVRDNGLITAHDSAESVDYVLRVTDTAGASTLITVNYGSTTYTTASATCKWIVIAQPYEDILSASDDISKLRSKRFGFTQIFERAIEETQSRKGMDMEAVMNELQFQIKRRTLEIKRELDTSVINGISYGTTSANVIEARTMMGIVNWIRDPDVDMTREDTLVTNNSRAALTIAQVNTLLYNIWDAGGLDESADPIIVVGAAMQRVIAGWESELRRVEQGERQTGYYRDIFLSDMGVELPVVLDRWMPQDKVIILDRSRVALRPLSGDGWHMEKMAKTGRSEKWQISGQYGLEVRNAQECHGMIIAAT